MNNAERVRAATLKLGEDEWIKDRVLPVLREVRKSLGEGPWRIEDLDAIGHLGNKFASQWEQHRSLCLSTTELIAIFDEDGQVIELDATLSKDDRPLVRIVILDGVSVDVLFIDDMLDMSVLGEFVEAEPEDLGWPTE